MPSAEVHDVLNDKDMSNKFILDAYNTLRILLNNYDATVPADVELNSAADYSWTPAVFERATIHTDNAGQQYVLVTSRPTKPGSPAAPEVLLTVSVISVIDAAQGDFPVAYVTADRGSAKSTARS